MAPRYTQVLAVVTSTALAPCAGLPNFLIYQPDDMDWMAQWSEQPQRPPDADSAPAWPTDNLDKLRAEGVVFTRGYSSSSLCSPSRFSVLTGRWASRARYGLVYSESCDWESAIAHVTVPAVKLDGAFDLANNLATALKQVSSSYQTGTFGKWHLTESATSDAKTSQYSTMQQRATAAGFDVAGAFYVSNLEDFTQTTFLARYGYTHNLEYIVAETLDFFEECLSADPPKPFFAYVCPTLPWNLATDESIREALLPTWATATPNGVLAELPDAGTMGMRDKADSMIAEHGIDSLGTLWVDDAFGALYNNLESAKVLDDTVIVFVSDHGRLAKSSLFENAMRIPFVVRYPPLFAAGHKVTQLVSNIDILPTFVDIAAEAAGTTPPSLTYDGLSFKALAAGDKDAEEGWRTTLFLEAFKHRAVVTESHKLIRLTTEYCTCKQTVCQHMSQYHPYALDTTQLYNLEAFYSEVATADNAEQNNIAEKRQNEEVLATLNAEIDAHMCSTQIKTTYMEDGNGKGTCGGDPLASSGATNDVEGCADLCESIDQCKYFSFGKAKNVCKLFEACSEDSAQGWTRYVLCRGLTA